MVRREILKKANLMLLLQSVGGNLPVREVLEQSPGEERGLRRKPRVMKKEMVHQQILCRCNLKRIQKRAKSQLQSVEGNLAVRAVLEGRPEEERRLRRKKHWATKKEMVPHQAPSRSNRFRIQMRRKSQLQSVGGSLLVRGGAAAKTRGRKKAHEGEAMDVDDGNVSPTSPLLVKADDLE
ncbi:hypothetical protein ACFX2C_038600 [Malus domestica]